MFSRVVALRPFLALGSSPTVSQAAAPAVRISVDFVFRTPVKPPVTRNV